MGTRPAVVVPPSALPVQPSRGLALAGGELSVVGWLVVLALFHGLIYLAFVPPWQHYDEPAHFLYAAEIAAGEGAAPGPRSAAISREVADSMYRFRFYPPGVQPLVAAPGGVNIGESQRVHSPLYYTLAAVPLGTLRFLGVEQQLYAVRVLSLGCYMLTVLAAWRIAVALLPDEPLLQLVLPALVVFAAAFADLMTAANSDVLINMSATVCLLGAVLLIRDGLRPLPLALALLGLTVAILTKRTALGASVPLALALLWSVRRTPLRPWVGVAILAGVGLVGGIAGLHAETIVGPSGPHTVLTARPWLVSLDRAYLRLNIDQWIESVTDVDRIGGRYELLVRIVFTSFWTRFSWGNLAAAPLWDVVMAALALAASVGLLVGVFREAPGLPLWRRRCLLMFFAAVVVAWLSVFVRLHPLPPVTEPIYVPRGRYMFWSLVPHIMLLALGLLWLVPRGWRNRSALALLACFVALDLSVWAWTFVRFYQLPLQQLSSTRGGLLGWPPLYLLLIVCYSAALGWAVIALWRRARGLAD